MTWTPLLLPADERPAPEFINRDRGLFIDGAEVPSSSGETSETVDPTTGAVLTRIAVASREDVDRAVAVARSALDAPGWADITPDRRSVLLLQIADTLERHADELATLDSLEMGGTLSLTRWMVDQVVEVFRHFAGWPTKFNGQTAPSVPTEFHYTVRRPVGVVVTISGWNGPMLQMGYKLAPALATGNTVVVKPSEQTSLSMLRVAELIRDETDIPRGVFNVVTGSGSTVGEMLITHDDVNKVSFTGSTQIGKHVLEVSTSNLKRVTLELGGKSPCIVFDDADLEAAAPLAAAGFCLGSGQGCVSGTRILVQRSVLDEFSAMLDARFGTYTLGDPFHPDTVMGPMASAAHYERVTGYIELAKQLGGTLAAGAEEVEGDNLFVPPTLVTGLDNRSRIAQEEIFGPVAVLIPFDDMDDAVRIANDSTYGLAASLFTRDLGRAHLTAARLEAGTVWVNTVSQMSTGSMPFGGFKQSGIGREHGFEVLEAYTEVKSVVMHL